MMVGVPVLFMVWVCACWPFVCVMGVVVGVCGWCVFQWCVAVVWASRRVPGVLVWGVCVLVCLGVVWLVSGACLGVVGVGVGVSWLVCVLWLFRMLTCLASFRVFLSWFCLFCLVNNGYLVVWAGACVLWTGESVFVCFLWVIGLLLVCWSRVVCVWVYWLLSCL